MSLRRGGQGRWLDGQEGKGHLTWRVGRLQAEATLSDHQECAGRKGSGMQTSCATQHGCPMGGLLREPSSVRRERSLSAHV